MTTGSGSNVNSNDLLRLVLYPDKSSGNPSTSAADQESYKYNALGDVKTVTQRNYNSTSQSYQSHDYSYDVVGRFTTDKATVIGDGVNGSVRRLETAYDAAGQPYLFTSWDATSGGNIVNQVQKEFNGLGQLVKEFQSHAGAVNTGTTPKVQYEYSDMSGGNHSRLTKIKYPNNRFLRYEEWGHRLLLFKQPSLSALRGIETSPIPFRTTQSQRSPSSMVVRGGEACQESEAPLLCRSRLTSGDPIGGCVAYFTLDAAQNVQFPRVFSMTFHAPGDRIMPVQRT